MSNSLSVRAGNKALAIIRDEGLNLDRVKVMAGASGAAKYLVLTGIDRILFSLFANRKAPLFLVGTSIGAFRMACFCHPDPMDAYIRLEQAYIHQYYPHKPTAKEVSIKSKEILDSFIADSDIEPIINHSTMRLNFLANRCKGLLASENRHLQGIGLFIAALTNMISRNALGWYFERALFHSPQMLPPFSTMDQFPMQTHELSKSNFKPALLSTGSIPIVMQGVSDIDGISGTFRDGGILDYHLDIPFLPADDDSIVLYPHFYHHLTPGWFDKHLNRKAKPSHLDNVVIVSPNPAFVESLPYRKIPDRTDFKTFHHDDKERVNYWQKTVKMSQRLGDELYNLIDSGAIAQEVQPL